MAKIEKPSNKIYGKQVTPGVEKKNDPAPYRIRSNRFKLELITTAEKIAGVKFNNRNWFLMQMRELYPNDKALHYVDRQFPHAEGGPLHVDEPRNEEQASLCKLKGEKLWKAGLRYCYITQDMGEADVRIQMDLYANALDNRR